MRKSVILPLLIFPAVFLAVGCNLLSGREEPLNVTNDCRGTWAEIYDGEQLLLARLNFGETRNVPLRGSNNRTIYLKAVLKETSTDQQVGVSETNRQIPQFLPGSGLFTPDQVQPWTINFVQSGNWNCQLGTRQ